MTMGKLIFFVFVTSFINIIDGNFPLPAITPEYCNSTEFYDSICVRCKRCGRDDNQANLQHRAPDGSCECKSDFYTKSRRGPHNVTCDSCPSGKFPSSDGKRCLSCGSRNPYNETTGNCQECMNGVLVEDGKELICLPCQRENEGLVSRCDSCSSSSMPNPESCAVLNKVYFGGECVLSAPNEPSQVTVKFENGVSVFSDFFAKHLAASLENCKEDDAACQVLANMCVMTMYKISFEDVCTKFRKLSKDRLEKCPRKQLWLFYIDEDDQRDAKRDLLRNNISNVFSPHPAQKSQLHIYAMKYALNGTFLGLFKVTSDNLNLCPESDVEDDIAFSFGTRLEKSCKISLQSLWKKSELVFYDLYLAYNDSKSEFYPIPVLIRGISVNGEFVNKGTDMSKWLLVRRFFLTDHVSGIENGTKLSRKQHQPLAKVFRYASDVSLKITTRSDGSPGMIYPPLLIISYSEAVPEDYMKNKQVTVKFSVSYTKDQSSVSQAILISQIVLEILAFVWSSIQTYSWFRRSDKHAIDLLTLGKFIIFMCGNVANIFFAVLFCVSLHWFVFFKRQDVIYTLLPTPDQENFLSIYLGVAFAMKAIQLIHLLAVQCNINIFFIDWERPRVRASSSTGRVTSSSKNVAETPADGKKAPTVKGTPDKINTEMAGVSIWRTYFAANEWAEIQSKRKLNLGLQVFGVLFFLKVLDFEDYALAGPNFNLPSSEIKKYVPYSTCCRFALGASVYLSIALFQIIFRKAIYERFIEDKLQQYVDLCSVSNVSVFILLTKKFGYYIHGRSTHGKADVNMKEMHEFLRKEEEDLCGHRGLIPNTEQQTFQIILPSGVHDQFLRLLVPLTSYSQAADRMQGVGGRLAKVDIDRVANTHYMLNKFLSGFIEHSFKDLDYVVKDKVLLENLLDIECYEVADRGYFYNDDGHSFSSVLFYGNESLLLLFDVLLFSIIDIAASDYILATILTGLVARVIIHIYADLDYLGEKLQLLYTHCTWKRDMTYGVLTILIERVMYPDGKIVPIIMSIRRSAGRRNLVRKALVDERFLT